MINRKGDAMTLKNELQQVMDRYAAAYQGHDAIGCAAVFTPDSQMMSPYGPPARGRQEIETVHAAWTSEGGEGKRLDIVECGGSGDVAWALARYSEGEATGEGTSLSVFQRHPVAGWLIHMCSLNADEAGS